MFRIQRIRSEEEGSISTPSSGEPWEKDTAGTVSDWFRPPTSHSPAFEKSVTSWRRLLGDPSFVDLVAEQGLDGE